MGEQDKQAVTDCVNELQPVGIREIRQTLSFDDRAYAQELLAECVAEGRIRKKVNGQYIGADASKGNAPTDPLRQGAQVPEYITNATTDELIKMANDGKLARAEVKRRVKSM